MNSKQRESLARVAYNTGQAATIAGLVGGATGKLAAWGFLLLVGSAILLVGFGLLLEKEASDESSD